MEIILLWRRHGIEWCRKLLGLSTWTRLVPTETVPLTLKWVGPVPMLCMLNPLATLLTENMLWLGVTD